MLQRFKIDIEFQRDYDRWTIQFTINFNLLEKVELLIKNPND